MKKILKIALVLTTLALFSTACSNVKSTNLIGTYKNGNYSVTVDADGYASLRYSGSTDTATMVGMSDDDFSSYMAFNNIYSMELIPWDLTSEKASYEYTSKEIDVVDYSSATPKTNKMTMKLTFKKDNDSIKCDANWTLSQNTKYTGYNNGTLVEKTFQSGSITLTK